VVEDLLRVLAVASVILAVALVALMPRGSGDS
jgi:hypothetical protein